MAPVAHRTYLLRRTVRVRDFWDPEAGRYTGHVGGHPRILEGLRNTNTTLLLRVLKQALDTIEAHSNNCVIVFRCRSSRHRSVACATLLALLCQLTDISFELSHLDGQTQSSTMRCGGNCHECHWCTTGTVTDVVTMMWDVFKRLGVGGSVPIVKDRLGKKNAR